MKLYQIDMYVNINQIFILYTSIYYGKHNSHFRLKKYKMAVLYEFFSLLAIILKKLFETTTASYSTESKGFLKNFDFTRTMSANKIKIVQNFLNLQHSRKPRYVLTDFFRIINCKMDCC